MPNKQHLPNNQTTEEDSRQHVDANVIAAIYGVSGRYILQLAAEGRIPCLRLGKKCVRFDPVAVANALES